MIGPYVNGHNGEGNKGDEEVMSTFGVDDRNIDVRQSN